MTMDWLNSTQFLMDAMDQKAAVPCTSHPPLVAPNHKNTSSLPSSLPSFAQRTAGNMAYAQHFPLAQKQQRAEEFSSGGCVCQSCDLVLGDFIVDTRSEWRVIILYPTHWSFKNALCPANFGICNL